MEPRFVDIEEAEKAEIKKETQKNNMLNNVFF